MEIMGKYCMLHEILWGLKGYSHINCMFRLALWKESNFRVRLCGLDTCGDECP